MLLPALLLALVPLQGTDSAGEQEPGKQEKPGPKVERFYLPRSKDRLYMELRQVSTDPMTPMLVLFHRTRSSKGEYRPIVGRLQQLGFNSLSVDLSSGESCGEIRNLTVKFGADRGRKTTLLDAQADIEEALLWARGQVAHGKLVAWGSGFSAALALREAALRPDLVDGVIAFSPAEVFAPLGMSATWIQESVRTVECPVFVSSARSEQADWQAIFDAIPAASKASYLPEGKGTSGSPALWPECADSPGYWSALEAFLTAHFATATPTATAPKGG